MSRSLRIILLRLADQVFSYEKAVLAGPDMETVHDMRVAARRLRAILRIFRKSFDREPLRAQIAMLSGLIRSLGKVRDCDIIIRNLDGLRHLLADDPHGPLDGFIERQRVFREAHAASLVQAVGRLREEGAKQGFIAFVRSSTASTAGPRPSLRESAAEMLARLLKETADYRREVVGHPGRVLVLHEMRIESRPLRYLMEALEPAFGRPFSRCLREIKEFLDVAGEIHDCDVMIEMLSGQMGGSAGGARRPRSTEEKARDVRIAKLLAAQRAARRKHFLDLGERFRELDRGKFRKKLLRSID